MNGAAGRLIWLFRNTSSPKRTLAKPYFRQRLTEPDVADALALLRGQARVVVPVRGVSGVATHPADDIVVATAIAGECAYLVTGDRPLRRITSYRDISIVTPAEFLQVLRASADG